MVKKARSLVSSTVLFFAVHALVSAAFAAGGRARLETHKDLIEKARNLTLQRDRLQTSQVLQRALRKEARGSGPFREISRALDELTGVFYTEKAQALHASAEGLIESKPREAIETLGVALRLEDANVSILKSLARAHLNLGECDRGDEFAKQAEAVHPVSPEVRLLRLQAADCGGNLSRVSELLAAPDVDLSPVEKFTRGLHIKTLLQKKDVKKARSVLQAWEAGSPEYPEVQLWRWRLATEQGESDRASALRYVQLCRELSPRKKKNYNVDLELCKGKEKVEEYLKKSGLDASVPAGGGESAEER